MVCKNCGAQMKTEDIFCEKCGAKNEPEVKDVSADYMPTVADDRNVTVSQPVLDDIGIYNEMLETVWPDWTIVNKLGEGSFGKVYKAERNEMGTTFNSAIKIISIPKNDSEIETIQAEAGLDDQSASSYFRTLVDDCVNEIKMMESFKGTQNIVSVEDYKVVPHKDKVGWTIFIRMELLTSFLSYTKNKVMTEKDVIKLGIDICSALECCAKLNVMHRDIKPENIFVSPFGDFKLGDFGIARKLEKTNSGMSKKGTYNYMAPEIYGGNGQYDYKSDIYSLGIVLYKLLNNNRFPLVDARSNAVTYQQMQEAFELRMSGVKLPKPMTASNALSNVILVACSFDPADRFSSASALKAALQNVQSGKADKAFEDGTVALPKTPVQANRLNSTVTSNTVSNQTAKTPKASKEKTPKPKKEKKPMSKGTKTKIIAALILVVLLVGAGTGLGLYFTNPTVKTLNAYKKGNFEEALSIYNAEVDEPSKKLISHFTERLTDVKTAFINKESDYDTVIKELTAITSFKISDIEKDTEATLSYIEALNEARNLFAEAEAFMADSNFVAAIGKYDEVIKQTEREDGVVLETAHFDYDAAVANKTKAADSYRQAELDKAAALKDEGNYTEAVEILDTALEVLEGDTVLSDTRQSYIDENNAKTKQEHLDKAAQFAEKENYERAIRELMAALEKFPGDKEIQNKIVTYQKENEDKIKKEVFEAVQKLLDEGDYPEAIKTVKKAVEDYPDIKDIYLKQNEIIKDYKKQIFTEVDSLVSNRKTSDALNCLDAAISVLPDDKEFIEKKKEIEGKQPVSISTLKVFAKDQWVWSEGTAKDPFGNTYTDKCNFIILEGVSFESKKHEVEYLVKDENTSVRYSTITGSIVPYETIPENSKAVVKVLVQSDGDEEYALAYSSPDIRRKTEVFDFVADITGAKYITIVVEITDETTPPETDQEKTETDSIILMDVQLWP